MFHAMALRHGLMKVTDDDQAGAVQNLIALFVGDKFNETC
jgi:hypothetical protein